MSHQSSTPSVVFNDIPAFPGYRAGEDGSLWTCWRFKGRGYGRPCAWHLGDFWKKLKPDVRKSDGRKRYNLRAEDGKRVRHYGSYFVLLAFVGPCPENCEACHEDGDPRNDAANNLRWDSHQSNIEDKQRHGTQQRGIQIHTAKLTEAEVIEIRSLREGGVLLRQLADRFGVTETMVSRICRRRSWKHVS